MTSMLNIGSGGARIEGLSFWSNAWHLSLGINNDGAKIGVIAAYMFL